MSIRDVLQIVFSLGGPFAGAYLAARLALQHYFKQRVWDRRADAHTAVFDSLERMANICRTDVDELVRDLNPTKEVKQHRLNTYRAAFEELKATLGGRTWIISDRMRKRLEKYLRRGRGNSTNDQSWSDYALREQEAIVTAIDDLRRLAREDLHVR